MSSRDLANLKNGLVAAWIPSLGSTGYRLVDRVGSNHGVLTNMDAGSDWVTSGGTGALDFDGLNDHITTGFAGVNTQTRSVSCWFKTSQSLTSSQYMAIVGWGLGSSGGACYVAIGADGNFGTNAFGVTQFGDGVAVENVTDGTWKHGCIVNTGATWHVYVNGVLGATKTMTTTPASGQNVIIGQWPFGTPLSSNANFLGQLDDIRIYNRALSATEVSLLSKERGIGFKTSSRSSSHFAKRYSYKPPKDKTYAAITRSQSDYDSLREGLVLAICPSVSGATGYRAVDVSGRGNHGTLTNMTPEDWVPSGGALSLDFDGSNDRVECPSLNDFTGDCTIAGWAYVYSGDTGGDAILIRTTNVFGGAARSGIGIVLREASTGLNLDRAAAEIMDGTTRYQVFSSTINRDTWYSYIAVRANGVLKLYVNGIEQSGSASFSGTITNNTVTFIGQTNDYSGASGGPQRTIFDDIRAYNRALTPPEIRLLASRRGIGLRSQKQTMFYQFPSGSKRRRILTGMT